MSLLNINANVLNLSVGFKLSFEEALVLDAVCYQNIPWARLCLDSMLDSSEMGACIDGRYIGHAPLTLNALKFILAQDYEGLRELFDEIMDKQFLESL
jgi:hypothetical protein